MRRFINRHLLPKIGGETVQAPCSNLTWGGMTAASHLKRINNIGENRLPFDYYWIDAGWYGNAGPNEDEFTTQWRSQAGDWSVNEETYPEGLKVISEAIHRRGLKFLLWVEPERAIFGTPVTLEYPEWFLGDRVSGQNLLLNLGDSAARSWCLQTVASLVCENDVDCYRQDFNLSPLPFWVAHDEPERAGITEIRYIEGLYIFLDELRKSHPNLLIDNCASGGRRLDFQMMRRSIPCWASDMQCFPDYVTERNLQQVAELAYWLPQFGLGTQSREGDTFHFRSAFAPGITVHLFSYERDKVRPDFPYSWLKERMEEYHRAKQFLSGDFYLLLETSDSLKSWSAMQFHRPDKDGGVLLAFRKSKSPIERIKFQLNGLNPEVTYRFDCKDTGEMFDKLGKELIEKGLPIEMDMPRSSRIYFYEPCGI